MFVANWVSLDLSHRLRIEWKKRIARDDGRLPTEFSYNLVNRTTRDCGLSFPYYLEYQNLRERCHMNRQDRIIPSWLCVSFPRKQEKSFLSLFASNLSEISFSNTCYSSRGGEQESSNRKTKRLYLQWISENVTRYVYQQRKKNNLRFMTDNQIADGKIKENPSSDEKFCLVRKHERSSNVEASTCRSLRVALIALSWSLSLATPIRGLFNVPTSIRGVCYRQYAIEVTNREFHGTFTIVFIRSIFQASIQPTADDRSLIQLYIKLYIM